VRFAREFALRSASLEVSGTLFNAVNSGSYQLVTSTSLASSSFGAKTLIQPPRSGQLGLRLRF